MINDYNDWFLNSDSSLISQKIIGGWANHNYRHRGATLFDNAKHKMYTSFMGAMLNFAPSNTHMLFAGENSSRQLCQHMSRRGLKKILVVTDKPLVELGVVEKAVSGLAQDGVEYEIFDGVLPDPSFGVVNKGAAIYRQAACDSILAIGGGSSIDSAKVIGLIVTNPGDPKDYQGFGKIKHPIPPLFAIPTTSGTGSEATMGAVITDDDTHAKVVITGAELLPKAACLDPVLLTGLPPHITAATGMDALTHAVEAYIGIWERGDCQENAAAAVKIIFRDLPTACENGSDLAAREGMAYASYLAGQAINQVNCGNVHAIAHQLGATYGIPHGLANAQVLPHVLEMSLPEARESLTDLAKLIGLQTAEDFIGKIRELNERLGIPARNDKIKRQDFDLLIERAVKEGFTCPVPRLMLAEDCQRILQQLMAE